MVFSEYMKQQIIFFHNQELRSTAIQKKLQKEGIAVSVVGIWKFVQQYKQFQSTEWRPGSACASIVSPRIDATIEATMQDDDETTAAQLQTIIRRKGSTLSHATIKCVHSRMCWTFRVFPEDK